MAIFGSGMQSKISIGAAVPIETAEKEVQDTSCRGSRGVPQIYKSPTIGGYRGLIKTISAVSYYGILQ